jgi:hypothetical protein
LDQGPESDNGLESDAVPVRRSRWLLTERASPVLRCESRRIARAFGAVLAEQTLDRYRADG